MPASPGLETPGECRDHGENVNDVNDTAMKEIARSRVAVDEPPQSPKEECQHSDAENTCPPDGRRRSSDVTTNRHHHRAEPDEGRSERYGTQQHPRQYGGGEMRECGGVCPVGRDR